MAQAEIEARNITHITLKMSRAEKYPAKQHATKVATRLGCRDGLIYLIGQYARNKEDSDMPVPWYQRRFFYYMSGVDEPNSCLTYDCKTGRLVLYLEEIDWDRVVWTGRGSTVEEAKEKYDVDDVRLNSQLFADIRGWVKRCSGKFYALHADHVPEGIDGLDIDSESLLPVMDACRTIKDAHEIELIKKANRISDAAHRAVLKSLPYAKTESDLSAVFQGVCISHQAPQAYDPIVGSGPNASTLHYSPKGDPLKGRQLVCLDAGAAWGLYASDITRTFPINGVLTEEAQAIYKLVERMQETSIAMCKPGVHMIDIHNHCHDLAIRGLLELGILHNGTPEEIFKSGTSKAFYPHGLGHHLGLETHDCQSAPVMRYLDTHPSESPVLDLKTALTPCRPEQPALQPGMVLTIEPGVYFNKQHLERNFLSKPEHAKYINTSVLKNYYDVGGVRIEDDLLITKSGYTNLTCTPKGEKALQIIRDAYDDHLCKTVTDWHGLKRKTFGQLLYYTDKVSVTRETGNFHPVRGYVYENILLFVAESCPPSTSSGGQSLGLRYLGMTAPTVYDLRASLLKRHMTVVETDEDKMTLELQLASAEVDRLCLKFERLDTLRAFTRAL